jgi:hypothetical protein
VVVVWSPSSIELYFQIARLIERERELEGRRNQKIHTRGYFYYSLIRFSFFLFSLKISAAASSSIQLIVCSDVVALE